MLYKLTKQAQEDLDNIWYYIAKDKISAANKVEDDILKAFELIASNPDMGAERPDLLNLPVRFWIIHNYYIIYKPGTRPIEILRIINCYQDIPSKKFFTDED